MPRIYFDNAATTPLDPRVRAAMQPYLDGDFGNPSSLHSEGRAARAAVEQARRHVAALVNAPENGVIFTASGTEANNLALRGVCAAARGKPIHVITSAIEHPAVRQVIRVLGRDGVATSVLRVSADGIVDPDELRAALRPETRLVSIMAANNVIGTLQPVRELAAVAHECGALFHTDAVQAAGHVPLALERDGIDLLSLSGHKLHGPKGVGALLVRKGVSLEPLVFGGGQEHGLRSGTENVPGIIGLGEAARLCRADQAVESARLVGLREGLIEGVLASVPGAYLIGHRYRRLPGNACFGFAGQEGEGMRLLLALDEAGVAVSTGSACSAHKANEPSHVLRALGYDEFRARGALRITLGRFNTEAELEVFLEILRRAVGQLRPITGRAPLTTGVV
ncbi:MAG: cysteine desulfurase [Phycisphaerae bacterium]|jgi:cysteine desulfurase|nr:cysteine desulfurase [Phycisphaerae bacterium]HPC20935.1 cysteine desulfurase family protein [Phycisphaerae bacterium]HRS27046.1 cysteine desulfurase family protein [Phycisphaerae bacterium]HRT40819.1 cysteine desulfurase family protein [Phycisphaerae bacterium]